jgi:hypothetical membrane protein
MPENNQRGNIKKILAAFGVVGPLIAIIGSITAMLASASWFNWLNNHLSDLGHPFMIGGSHGIPGSNPAATFFNGGLIIGGFVTLLFAFRIIIDQREKSSRLGILGGLVFAIATIFLMFVGIFNEASGSIHFAFSVMFFAALLMAGILYGSRLIRESDTRLIGYIAIISAIISGFLWTLTFGFPEIPPWTAFAIPETVSALTSFLWIALLSIRMIKH